MASSPYTSLLVSILIFPPSELDDPAWLTALGAVAVAECIDARSPSPARIKWPNDVLVAGRKISGVLVERGQGSVIGIGINVNTSPDHFPLNLRSSATSLSMVLGQRIDRSDLARELIQRLDGLYHAGLSDGLRPLNHAWQKRLIILGRHVRVLTRSGTMAGRLVDADLLLGLELEQENGCTILIPQADILGVEDCASSQTQTVI